MVTFKMFNTVKLWNC